MALAVVRDLRARQGAASEEELVDFETDVLAGFVLARAAAGLVDGTIRNDTSHLGQIRQWFGRPLWEMEPSEADAYFGHELRNASPSMRTGRAGALAVYFQFLELRHKVEPYDLTGRVVECPLDEMNTPRMSVEPQLRIPPAEAEVEQLFAGWREELVTCRKFAPAARNYMVARLCADVGMRINEAVMLDLDDVRWELGRFGKLNVRFGKGSRRRGPKPRLVPLINGADQGPDVVHRECVGPVRRRPHSAGCSAVPVRAPEPGRLLWARNGRGVPQIVKQRHHSLSAGMGRQAHAARATPFLRVAALPGRHEPVRYPGTSRSQLDRNDGSVHSRSPRPRRGCLGFRSATRRASMGRTGSMRWNLRLAAANRGIWKASQLHRMLAERGMVISTGKMSGLWSGRPNTIKLDELDIICAVLGCGVEELLLPEPETVPTPAPNTTQRSAAVGEARAVTPRPRTDRSLPPR